MDKFFLDSKDIDFIQKGAKIILKYKGITEEAEGVLKFRDQVGELLHISGDYFYNQFLNNPNPHISKKALDALKNSVNRFFDEIKKSGVFQYEGFSKTQFDNFYKKITTQKSILVRDKKKRIQENNEVDTFQIHKQGSFESEAHSFLQHFENTSWNLYSNLDDIVFTNNISIHFKNITSLGLETELRDQKDDEIYRILQGMSFVNLKGKVLVGQLESMDKEYPYMHFSLQLPDVSEEQTLIDGITTVINKSSLFVKHNLITSYIILKKSTVPLENVKDHIREELLVNGKNQISIVNRYTDLAIKQTYSNIYKTFGKKVMFYKAESDDKIKHDFITLAEYGNYEFVLRTHLSGYDKDFGNDHLVGYGVANLYERYIAFSLYDPTPYPEENKVEREFVFLTLYFSKFYNFHGIIFASIITSGSRFSIPKEDEYIYQAKAILLNYDIWPKLKERETILLKYIDQFKFNSKNNVDSLFTELESELREIISL